MRFTTMCVENPNTDTASDASLEPRMKFAPMTLELLDGPIHLRYGFQSASDMADIRSKMDRFWRGVEEQELTNRLLEWQIRIMLDRPTISGISLDPTLGDLLPELDSIRRSMDT